MLYGLACENDGKMDGTQTSCEWYRTDCNLENDVKMYGAQTNILRLQRELRLRMM